MAQFRKLIFVFNPDGHLRNSRYVIGLNFFNKIFTGLGQMIVSSGGTESKSFIGIKLDGFLILAFDYLKIRAIKAIIGRKVSQDDIIHDGHVFFGPHLGLESSSANLRKSCNWYEQERN